MARTNAAQPAEYDKTLAAEAAAVNADSATPDLVLAAQKRAAARQAKDPAERAQQEIDALLIERRGYQFRVGLVDEQLKARGYKG